MASFMLREWSAATSCRIISITREMRTCVTAASRFWSPPLIIWRMWRGVFLATMVAVTLHIHVGNASRLLIASSRRRLIAAMVC